MYDYNNKYTFKIKNGNGKGKEYNEKGKLIFKGKYINGKKTGKVIEYGFINNLDYVKAKGEFLNGEKFGIWKEYDSDNLEFEGKYLNGKRDGKGKEYD